MLTVIRCFLPSIDYSMNTGNEEKFIFNTAVAKIIGFYHLLNPETIKYRGFNIFHIIIVAFFVFYSSPIIMVMYFNSFYYWANNPTTSLVYLLNTTNCTFLSYKMVVIIYHSENIWNCMEITRFDFLSYKFYNKSILEKWRTISIKITTIYSTMIFLGFSCYILSPLLFTDSYYSIKNHDGSISNYRLSVFNLYSLLSSETLNKYFILFYSIEVLDSCAYGIVFILFDIILVTLCLAITCQLQMISRAFESIGHKSNIHPSSKYHTKDRY